MEISRDDVIHVAKLARLDLTDDEIAVLTEQLADILEHAARVTNLDTEDVAPTAHPLELANVLRDDTERPSLDREIVLAQAPASEKGYFRVPRILEGGGS